MTCIVAFLRTGSWAAAPECILKSRCPTDWRDSTGIAVATTNKIYHVVAVRPAVSARHGQPVVIPNPAAFFADGVRDLLLGLRGVTTHNHPDARDRLNEIFRQPVNIMFIPAGKQRIVFTLWKSCVIQNELRAGVLRFQLKFYD